MSGRGELPCSRCKEVKRRDKLVQVTTIVNKVLLCKHCRAAMVYQLRQLEKIALLSE